MRMYRYNYKNFFQTGALWYNIIIYNLHTIFSFNNITRFSPYIVQNIPNTNLVLLVYEKSCYVENLRPELDVTYPKEKKYGETGKLHLPCFIESNNDYFKRPYIKCITADEEEKTINENIRYCGGQQKHIREEL